MAQTPPISNRKSGSIQGTPSFRRTSTGGRGSSSALRFSRTDQDKEFPHATKKNMADFVAKLEHQFTLTPQRMRM